MPNLSTKAKIMNYLAKGKTLTVKQAQNLFRATGIRQRIAELRQEGFPHIYTNRVRNSRGDIVFQYRLGSPTTSMIKEARRSGVTLSWN